MYYKWKHAILPDDKSREIHKQPERIDIVSSETFTDFDSCFRAGREEDYSIPNCFGGPYMSILQCDNKQSLEILHANTKNAKIDASDLTVNELQIDRIPETTKETKVYFKWQFAFEPGRPWKKPVYFEIGEKTFTSYGRCLGDSINADLDVPRSWGGYYLHILESQSKDVLERVYDQNKRGELEEFGDDVTIHIIYDNDCTVKVLKNMCKHIDQ